MLQGQDIGLTEVMWISVFGMTVATIAVVLLMIFVIILSKVVSRGSDPLIQEKAGTSALLPGEVHSGDISEEEVAAIAVALCAETGKQPDQFRIVSIARCLVLSKKIT